MDSKTLRLSIAAIITTVVLIGVVVYAANKDRIDSMIGAGKTEETVMDEAEAESDGTDTQYGEQIGDNLKGFLTADDFFDKSEQRPSVVVVVDNVPVPANGSSEDGTTDLTDIPADNIDGSGEKQDEDSAKDDSSKNNSGNSGESDPEKDESEKPDGDLPEGVAPPDKPDEEDAPKKPEGEKSGEASSDSASSASSSDTASSDASSDSASSDSSSSSGASEGSTENSSAEAESQESASN